MRRLKLLLDLRSYLGALKSKHNKLRTTKVNYMITKYCHLKSAELAKTIKLTLQDFQQELGLLALIKII
jgi:hypothetical protein